MNNLKSLIKKLLKGSMVIGLSTALLLSSCDKEKKENPLKPTEIEPNGTENQVNEHIIAKYKVMSGGACGTSFDTYEKLNDKYTQINICTLINNTNQIDISEDKFKQQIYISSYLDICGRTNFEEIPIESVSNPHPEASKYIRNTTWDGTNLRDSTTIGYNTNNEVIAEIKHMALPFGPDWYKVLISYTNIVIK